MCKKEKKLRPSNNGWKLALFGCTLLLASQNASAFGHHAPPEVIAEANVQQNRVTGRVADHEGNPLRG